jgi:diguanylate cyclase (GGDEF)-like protein
LTLKWSRLYSSGVNKDKASKVRLLKELGVFETLTREELELIAEGSAWRSFGKGEKVYSTGEGAEAADGRVYAVERGEVLITKSGDEKRDIALATFVEGESFGELSLFHREPAGTSARCEEDTTLLVFPAEADQAVQMETLFQGRPQIKAKILRNLLAIVARRIRSTNRAIAEKSPWVQELKRQVMLDKLTGLYNAGYLEEELPRLLERQEACFLMIKPDNLKTLNDSYGHQAGDRTLQLMAAELLDRLGPRGVPIRYKGDVFSVILPGASLQAAVEIAEELRAGLAKLDVSEVSLESGQPRADLRITVSIGIAAGGRTAEGLVDRAYKNLFVARGGGGDRLCSEQSP